MNATARAFGRRLKDARERNGITLDAVAASTKIKASLLAGLERGDLSHWPNGIFRRAFVREYASAIGLAPEAVIEEFVRIFPGDGIAPLIISDAHSAAMRLTLAPDRKTLFGRAGIARVLIAASELAVVVLVGASLAHALNANLWTVSGVTGLLYYSMATAVFGRSLASSWLNGELKWKRRLRPSPRPMTTADRLQVVSRRPEPRAMQTTPAESNEIADSPAAALRAALR